MRGEWVRSWGRWLGAYGVVVSIAVGCGDDSEPATCEHNGKRHTAGDMFPAGDGCNTCSCAENGSVVCTTRGCSSECEYDGEIYRPGDVFAATDGCNNCTCENNGSVSCTEEACTADCSYQGRSFPNGSSFPAADGCNTCSCEDGRVACTERGCPREEGCRYSGVFYPVGAGFPSMNGCNKCSCVAPNQVQCTDEVCFRCYFNGLNYQTGETFEGDDGCSSCRCQEDGSVTCDAGDCPTEGCRFGASWYGVGESVLCPDGCNTCTCEESGDWAWEGGLMCPLRFADLCIAGPGDNAVEGSILYRSANALAVETEDETCTSGLVLCFRETGSTAEPLPIELWLLDTGQSCDEPKTQFVFDLSTIRGYVAPRYPGRQQQVVSLEMNGQTVLYPY